MKHDLKSRLQQGLLLFDGAMGTEIYRHNIFVNACYEGLNLSNPSLISTIHRDYIEAGADVLTTNTFGANRNKLMRHGLSGELRAINAAGVALARAAAREETLIAGSIGPVGELLLSDGVSAEEQAAVCLCEHIEALIAAEPDFIIFESMSEFAAMERVLRIMQDYENMPYVISFTLDRQAQAACGEEPPQIMRALESVKHKPTAFGLNCGGGPALMLSNVEKVMPCCHLPVIVQPNGGVPQKVEDRLIYMSSPEYFATYGARFVQLGVRGCGGCCGTQPDHIRELSRALRPLKAMESHEQTPVPQSAVDVVEPKPEIPLAERSSLAAKIAHGQWVWTTELTPPRSFDLTPIVEKARFCLENGFDAMNIPDGPRASARLSPIVVAIEVQRLAGIEVVLHVCARDRNLIGLQSDLLGCAAAQVNNLLFITGDPPKLGDYPFASAVFDTDSIGMVRIQKRLNQGIDLGSKALDAPTKAFIAVGTDPNALDLKREIRRLHEKIEAGAQCVITQPVFDPDALKRFLDEAALTVPVIAGIWPLASYRNAEFMKNEVPGVTVPDSILKRMAQSNDKESQRLTGIAIAREAIAAIRSDVDGVQISAPFGNVRTAVAVMTE